MMRQLNLHQIFATRLHGGDKGDIV